MWVGAERACGNGRPVLPPVIWRHQSAGAARWTQGDGGAGLVVAIRGRPSNHRQDGDGLSASWGAVAFECWNCPSRSQRWALDRHDAHGLVDSYQGKTTTFTHNDGLSSDQVTALFEGTEGSIWVATSEGLDQFRELPVNSLPVKQGLSSPTTNSVLAARDGSIWIGTAGGLYRWDHGRTRFTEAKQSRPRRRRDSIALRG